MPYCERCNRWVQEYDAPTYGQSAAAARPAITSSSVREGSVPPVAADPARQDLVAEIDGFLADCPAEKVSKFRYQELLAQASDRIVFLWDTYKEQCEYGVEQTRRVADLERQLAAAQTALSDAKPFIDVLAELFRLYKLRFDIAEDEREGKDCRKALREYGEQKKRAWEETEQLFAARARSGTEGDKRG